MSKTVKRKVSVELQEKPSSKNRLSVFDRLGTKKSKSIVSFAVLLSKTAQQKKTKHSQKQKKVVNLVQSSQF